MNSILQSISGDIMKTTMMITKSKEAFLLNRLSEFENKKAFDSKSVVIHIRQAADEYFHTVSYRNFIYFMCSVLITEMKSSI